MTANQRTAFPAEAGFSLVEGLIAALILLLVILGVIPLISQSMLNNLQGNDASFQTSSSVDGTETLLSLPFNAPDLAVAPATTATVAEDVFTLETNRWLDRVIFDADGTLTAHFTRTATIEQFGADDLDGADTVMGDPGRTLDNPLDGITAAGSVHFKRIRMEIQSERSMLNLAGSRIGNYEIVTVHTY